MPRRLKTYTTSSGFFELAVAAPTMKAALEIWGAGRDLFQRGYAKETNDRAIVKATMANPGTVLRRAVGALGVFKEKAELPDVSTWEKSVKKPVVPKAPAPNAVAVPKPEPAKSETAKPKGPAAATERKAARLYEAARKKHEREEERSLALEKKRRERRDRAINQAEIALAAGCERHAKRIADNEKERRRLERGAADEDRRWEEEKRDLEAALRQARDV
jgi:colicin import membrane protein